MNKNILAVSCVSFLMFSGCSRMTRETAEAAASAAEGTSAPGIAEIPSGTSFRVRLLETLDTKRNRAGDHFTATLDEPWMSGDRVVVPTGTSFQGHLIECRPSGRFKGRAIIALQLDSFILDGQTHEIRSHSFTRVSKGHKKHHFLWIGGGAGGGAVIGAIAAGGPAALIGASAGAAAGTVGSVITGRRNVRLPVESSVRFSLQNPVVVGI